MSHTSETTLSVEKEEWYQQLDGCEFTAVGIRGEAPEMLESEDDWLSDEF